MMTKMLNLLAKVIEISIGVILSTMVLVVSAEVFTRYVLSDSLRGSYELARYLFIWLCFLAPSQGVRRGELICITFVRDALPPRIAKSVLVISISLILVFLSFVFWKGMIVVSNASIQLSPALRINMAIPYLGIPLGCFLIAIFLMESFVKVIRTRY